MMNDELRQEILKLIDETISSRTVNQQATLTFNLENCDAERKLNRMLEADKYVICLYDICEFLQHMLKYETEGIVKHQTVSGEYKDITLDALTVKYISNKFHQLLEDNKISQDDLYE